MAADLGQLLSDVRHAFDTRVNRFRETSDDTERADIRKELAKLRATIDDLQDDVHQLLDPEGNPTRKVAEYHIPPQAYDGRLVSNYELLAPFRWYLQEVVSCDAHAAIPPEDQLIFGRPSCPIRITGWQLKALYDTLITAPNMLVDLPHQFAVRMADLMGFANNGPGDNCDDDEAFESLLGKCLLMITEPPGALIEPISFPSVPKKVIKPPNPDTAWSKVQEAAAKVDDDGKISIKMLEKYYPGFRREIHTLAVALDRVPPRRDAHEYDVSGWSEQEKIALQQHLYEYPYIAPGTIVFTPKEFDAFLAKKPMLRHPRLMPVRLYGKRLTNVVKFHVQRFMTAREVENDRKRKKPEPESKPESKQESKPRHLVEEMTHAIDRHQQFKETLSQLL